MSEWTYVTGKTMPYSTDPYHASAKEIREVTKVRPSPSGFPFYSHPHSHSDSPWQAGRACANVSLYRAVFPWCVAPWHPALWRPLVPAVGVWAMQVFLIRHLGDERASSPHFVLDLEEIYVLDAQDSSIRRANVLVRNKTWAPVRSECALLGGSQAASPCHRQPAARRGSRPQGRGEGAWAPRFMSPCAVLVALCVSVFIPGGGAYRRGAR